MLLSKKDLKVRLSRKEYEAKAREWCLRLVRVERHLIKYERAAVVLFEGPDAAGKGGAIKRLTEFLDPRGYKAYAIGPPTEDERKRHYLWRFWTRMPKRSEMSLFDRSWYGRVLVEKVEKLTPKARLEQAYAEINQFEATLVDDGTDVIKFWLDISRKEQHRRFIGRDKDPLKRWKLTKEDWRNRKHWSQYAEAARIMVRKTNTERAPWVIVAAEDKDYARLMVIRTVTERLEALAK